MPSKKDLCGCGNPKNSRAKQCRNCFSGGGLETIECGREECEIVFEAYRCNARIYCSQTCCKAQQSREAQGARYIDSDGYVRILMRDHPNARKDGRVFEHTIVMAEMLGRPLFQGEEVHHMNGVRSDNRPENLELWVVSQPAGQRVEDIVSWASEILSKYSPDFPVQSDIKLDFSDVLILPQLSDVASRKDVELKGDYTFLHSSQVWTGIVPIISSNMTSVTTPMVAYKMAERGMMACLPKTIESFDENYFPNLIPSIGLQGDIESIKSKAVCLDVPNAYITPVIEMTKAIRKRHPDIVLIVGNVVTKTGVAALLTAGADVVKCGIGSGAACATRIVTGVGMPQLSTVLECAKEAHRLGGMIISDGGHTVPGDVVKALAASADWVMLGSMLAGHDENAEICSMCNGTGSLWKNGGDLGCPQCNETGKIGAFYGMSSERGNGELAGGLKNYRASEGWEIKLPDRGPIDGTLQDIEGGIRSACSYVGARSIKDLPKCATFVQVNRQANTSMWENRV